MTGVLGILTKAPEPGKVKTRLAATRGQEFATQFATACLQDTWLGFSNFPRLDTRLILEGDAVLPLEPPPVIWKQAAGDLGARMEAALSQALTQADFAILIGTDSPGLPAAYVEQAVELLAGILYNPAKKACV